MGNGLLTYDPYNVYRLSDTPGGKANLSLSLSKRYNLVLCAVPNRNPDDPKLVGPIAGIRMEPGTMLHSIYGGAEAIEEHFCNYEVNAEYVSRFKAAGLRLAAWGPQGELKAFELPTHRFFVAMLFQPQRAQKQPHPVVAAFVKAAGAFGEVHTADRAKV